MEQLRRSKSADDVRSPALISGADLAGKHEDGAMGSKSVSRFDVTADQERLNEAREFLATKTTNWQALKIDSKGSALRTFFFALGFFFTLGQLGRTSAAEKNGAKKLLANPTYDISRGVRVFGEVNEILRRNGIEPITLDNYGGFLGQLEKKEFDNNLPETFQLRLELLTQRFGGRDEHGEAITVSLRELVEPAAQALEKWGDSILSLRAERTDGQLQGLIAYSTNNVLSKEKVKSHETGKAFMVENAATLWARNNVERFADEIANEFIGQVSGLTMGHDAIQTLIVKIDDRAGRMHQILGGELGEHKEAILAELNKNTKFVDALETKQAELKKVVSENQDLRLLSAGQIETLRAQVNEIETAEKKLNGNTRKGEGAVVDAFTALLHPVSTLAALRTAGGQMQLVEETAKNAVTIFKNIEKGLNVLLNGNAVVIAKGQARADEALRELELLNGLVSHQDHAQLALDKDTVSQPIRELSKGGVAQELKNELLDIIGRLAGNEQNHASPTVLEKFLRNLGDEGMQAVLGQSFNLFEIFSKTSTSSRENVHYGNQQMLDLQPEGIQALREQISKTRDIEAAKIQRQAQEAAAAQKEAVEIEPVRDSRPFPEEAVEGKKGLLGRVASAIGGFFSAQVRSKPNSEVVPTMNGATLVRKGSTASADLPSGKSGKEERGGEIAEAASATLSQDAEALSEEGREGNFSRLVSRVADLFRSPLTRREGLESMIRSAEQKAGGTERTGSSAALRLSADRDYGSDTGSRASVDGWESDEESR